MVRSIVPFLALIRTSLSKSLNKIIAHVPESLNVKSLPLHFVQAPWNAQCLHAGLGLGRPWSGGHIRRDTLRMCLVALPE
jgi:hypothetical protein